MGEVVLARTSPTLHPPCPPTVYELLWLALWELKNSPCIMIMSSLYTILARAAAMCLILVAWSKTILIQYNNGRFCEANCVGYVRDLKYDVELKTRFSLRLISDFKSWTIIYSLFLLVIYTHKGSRSGEVTDGLVVIAGVSVTWNILSWSGGHEFKPRPGWTWGAWYFCPKSYLNQTHHLHQTLGS